MKIIYAAVFILAVNLANAQTPPNPILELSKQSDILVKKGDLTSEQRSYLWSKTAHDRTGFLVVEVDKNYLDTIRYFVNDPALKAEAIPALIGLNSKMSTLGFSFLGNLVEDRYRYDAIYRESNRDLLMITRWEYKKAGAFISTAEEFFNQKIYDKNAVLSLAIAPNEKNGIWKLTWVSNGVLYEIYLSDNLDAYGKPSKVPEKIIEVAKEVIFNLEVKS